MRTGSSPFSTHPTHSHTYSHPSLPCAVVQHALCWLPSRWRTGAERVGVILPSSFICLHSDSPQWQPQTHNSGSLLPLPPSDLRTAKAECVTLLSYTLNPTKVSVSNPINQSLSEPSGMNSFVFFRQTLIARTGKETDIYQHLLCIRQYTKQFYINYII